MVRQKPLNTINAQFKKRKKTGILNLIKFKNFCFVKDIVKRMKSYRLEENVYELHT